MKQYSQDRSEIMTILAILGFIVIFFTVIALAAGWYLSSTFSSSSFNPIGKAQNFDKTSYEEKLGINLPSENQILVNYDGNDKIHGTGIKYIVYRLDINSLVNIKRAAASSYNWYRRPNNHIKKAIRESSKYISKIPDNRVQTCRLSASISNGYYFCAFNSEHGNSNRNSGSFYRLDSSSSNILAVLDLNKNLLYIFEN